MVKLDTGASLFGFVLIYFKPVVYEAAMWCCLIVVFNLVPQTVAAPKVMSPILWWWKKQV